MEVKMVSYICSKSVFGFSRNETCTVYMSYIIMGKKAENGRVQRSSRKLKHASYIEVKRKRG